MLCLLVLELFLGTMMVTELLLRNQATHIQDCLEVIVSLSFPE